MYDFLRALLDASIPLLASFWLFFNSYRLRKLESEFEKSQKFKKYGLLILGLSLIIFFNNLLLKGN